MTQPESRFIKWNLICERGHYHYSPEPMSWVGKKCGLRYFNKKHKKVTCRKDMMLLADYIPTIPKRVRVKKKVRKVKKFISRI